MPTDNTKQPSEPTFEQITAQANIDDSLQDIYTLAVSFENVGNSCVARTLRIAYARLRAGLITLGVNVNCDEIAKKPLGGVR